MFWGGVLVIGNLLPLLALVFGGSGAPVLAFTGAAVLAGIYLTERIWVEAPQRIPLV